MNADIVNAIVQSLKLVAPEAVLVLGACVLFLGTTWKASRDLWGVAALLTLVAAALALVTVTPQPVRARRSDPEQLEQLIRRLGADKFDERERAMRDLEGIGQPALPALRKAQAEDKEPEVKERARRLIETIEGQRPRIFGVSFRVDSLGQFLKIVALVAGAVLVLIAWKEYPDAVAGECFACLLVITAGLSLVGTANDLITLFLTLELISIPSYVLLYLPRSDKPAQEAAMKYFLLSIFTSALLLFGFSYLYGLTGTTNLPAIADALGKAPRLPLLALVALVMIVAGLGFKITAVPFHFYAPDVYQGTPPSNAALLAFVPKAAGFVALMRVLAFVPAEHGPQGANPGLILGGDGLTLLWILSAVTMTLGNVLALLQDNLKRMLAYSSVAHAGYMLIGLTVAAAPGASRVTDWPSGVEAVLFYLVAYGAMTIGAFGVLVYLSTPERRVESIDDVAGLSRSHPGVALLMALFLLSLIGIPLTAGFAGKLFLFLGAVGVPNPVDGGTFLQRNLFRILALIGALNAAAAAYYYLRVAVVMYLRTPLRPLENRWSLPGLVGLLVCGLLTLAFGVYPKPLLRSIEEAVPRGAVSRLEPPAELVIGQR